MTRFWLSTLTHVNFNRVNKIEARHKVLRLNVKLSEVLFFTLTCSLSYVASIFFANVNFTLLRTKTVEINPYIGLINFVNVPISTNEMKCQIDI